MLLMHFAIQCEHCNNLFCWQKSKKHKLESASTAEEEASTSSKRSKDSGESAAKSTSKLANGVHSKSSTTTAKDPKPKNIQSDPSATKAFKSLFTTSEKAKNQPAPHWVTYNPCYY